MQQIQVTASFTIETANVASFRAIAGQLITAVREREPDTLQYLWYYSDDGTRCAVREIYRDSAAVLHHLENCSELLPKLLEVGTITVEMCGPASDQLREALQPIGPQFLNYDAGVDRVVEP